MKYRNAHMRDPRRLKFPMGITSSYLGGPPAGSANVYAYSSRSQGANVEVDIYCFTSIDIECRKWDGGLCRHQIKIISSMLV